MCYTCLDREFSVEQSNVYFTVIGEALQKLWHFEYRHANSRNLPCVFNTFYSRSSFLDYAGLRVNVIIQNAALQKNKKKNTERRSKIQTCMYLLQVELNGTWFLKYHNINSLFLRSLFGFI